MMEINPMMITIGILLLAYLSGSMLWAYWIPKWFCHVDIIKESEDKNPGTANAFMKAGICCGITVLILELLKGFLPVYVGGKMITRTTANLALLLTAPVAGHAFSCFHKGKGGKAIAVSFGVLLGLLPDLRPVLLLAFYFILFSTVLYIPSHKKRSITTFICWSVTVCLTIRQQTIGFASLGIAAIVIAKHENLPEALRHQLQEQKKSFPFIK